MPKKLKTPEKFDLGLWLSRNRWRFRTEPPPLVAPSPSDGVAIDEDGIRCDFESRGCTELLIGAGGLDRHHRFPKFMGGDETKERLLLLCPNHHRRQHALLRFMIENGVIDKGDDRFYKVMRHFTDVELTTAAHAVTLWMADGSPAIRGWNVPAARDT